MSEIDDLYQEVILHHSKTPRNFGVLEQASHVADGSNPLCGDKLHLTLVVQDDRVADVRFTGDGCAISTASASVMTDLVKGKTLDEASAMFEAFHGLVTGESAEKAAPDLGKLQIFAGVQRFPARVKCAMLAWRTLEAALTRGGTVTTE